MSPLSNYLIIFILFLTVWAGFIFWQYQHIRKEARTVFDAQLSRREIPANEPFAPYERAYLKTSELRTSIYRWLATITAFFMMLGAWILVSMIWTRAYYLSGTPAWMTEGELVHSFVLALSGMAGLFLAAFVFVRHYHMNRPEQFERVWEREKSQG